MLRQRLREARKNDAGFTLVELLIVVVILGVLSGIVVFAVGNFKDDGVAAACKADLKNVETAAEAYYAKSDPHVYVDVATLKSSGYLRDVPPASEAITVNTTSGVVSSTTCPAA